MSLYIKVNNFVSIFFFKFKTLFYDPCINISLTFLFEILDHLKQDLAAETKTHLRQPAQNPKLRTSKTKDFLKMFLTMVKDVLGSWMTFGCGYL